PRVGGVAGLGLELIGLAWFSGEDPPRLTSRPLAAGLSHAQPSGLPAPPDRLGLLARHPCAPSTLRQLFRDSCRRRHGAAGARHGAIDNKDRLRPGKESHLSAAGGTDLSDLLGCGWSLTAVPG